MGDGRVAGLKIRWVAAESLGAAAKNKAMDCWLELLAGKDW